MICKDVFSEIWRGGFLDWWVENLSLILALLFPLGEAAELGASHFSRAQLYPLSGPLPSLP